MPVALLLLALAQTPLAPVAAEPGAQDPPTASAERPARIPITPRVTDLDPALTSMAQFAVGAAFMGLTPSLLWLMTAVLGPACAPCAVLGGLGACTFVCFGPVITVFLEALVGDTLGSQRGAMLWPIALAYGAGCGVLALQAAALAIVGIVLGVAAVEPLVEQRFDDVGPTLERSLSSGEPFLQVALIVAAIVTPLAVAGAPAFTWSMFAENKRMGDRGQPAWPGLLTPQHPPPIPASAMAY